MNHFFAMSSLLARRAALKDCRMSRPTVKRFISVIIRICRQQVAIVVVPALKFFPKTSGTHMQGKWGTAGQFLIVGNQPTAIGNIGLDRKIVTGPCLLSAGEPGL